MDGDVDRIIDLVDKAQSANSAADLINHFRDLVESLGFNYFILAGLPWDGVPAPSLIAATNWPLKWQEVYRKRGYFLHDPIALAAQLSHSPFLWKTAYDRFGQTKIAEQLKADAANFGIVEGIAFPFLDPQHRQAVASLTTDHVVNLKPRVVVILHGVIPHVYNRLRELNPVAAQVGRLTSREAEVLRWVSKGKTAFETGEILEMSERTVKFHIQNAKTKLRTNSVTQAVAVAIHTRQI